MDKSISKLLGEDTLPQELVASLQEAFDKKVVDARAEAEAEVREEFAARYEHDKSNLVEAMDRMLTDVVRRHETERADSVRQFTEARNAFRRAVREARAQAASKLNENLSRSRQFVTAKLTAEIAKLREEKKALTKERLASAGKLGAIKESLAAGQAQRLGKIDEFVVRQVKRELNEFNDDHRALVETRVKLVAESRKKLRETQTRFVKDAARNVEKVITESMTREMRQLHEDLEKNRQNMFGRRIFEAVAAEFMTSYLAEGTEIRKLQTTLEAKEGELATTKVKFDEVVKESQQAARKARLAEDRAVRGKVMGELLSNLRGDKRQVMEGMLETVRTEALRESFGKLLPVVLEETRRPAAPGRQSLSETPRPSPRPAAVITGDNRSATRLFETVQAETTELDDIAKVVRLAGIQK